ncbi:AAA family ATPase [Buchananella felis]|uniref:AAA family ATPase n=1 Tax=Buchananella felis TaxID=3231492 RepID=UPI00352718E2
MAVTVEKARWFAEAFNTIVDNIGRALLGKQDVVRLAVTCMLAEGHLLLEDAPGTGKTALARAIAATVDCSHSRIQFTPDLLPLDITGTTMPDKSGRWEFRKGPIFASIVLADEINRASPKTQSALLEVMEEAKVTNDNVRHDVGRPFLVIATQNPIEQAGTYRLPEAQLDRFMMKCSLGYPARAAGVEILLGSGNPDRSQSLSPVLNGRAVADMSDLAKQTHVSEPVALFVQQLVEQTRAHPAVRLGVSTRGGISMMRAARVWAMAQGRHYVVPEDITALAEQVWAHRIVMDPDAEFSGATAQQVVADSLAAVPAPTA